MLFFKETVEKIRERKLDKDTDLSALAKRIVLITTINVLLAGFLVGIAFLANYTLNRTLESVINILSTVRDLKMVLSDFDVKFQKSHASFWNLMSLPFLLTGFVILITPILRIVSYFEGRSGKNFQCKASTIAATAINLTFHICTLSTKGWKVSVSRSTQALVAPC